MNVFATSDLKGWSRVADWNQAVAAQLAPWDFRPKQADRFAARLVDSDLGALRIARLTCDDATIEHDAAQPSRREPRSYFLILQRSGGAEISHYGNTALLAAGDMVLCDGTAPMKMVLHGGAELLILRVAAATLKEHLPSPECYCGKTLPGGEGLTGTAAAMMVSLLDQLEAGLSLHYQERVARHLLDMIATAYAVGFDTPSSRSSIVSGRCATVKLFIEQHLRDPDMTPCSIAARMKLSSRYLRMIFASENETVSAYILRRRLEQCARQIADPTWRGHSMTEIAFGWGFNSAPHFTRTFRDRYNMPPREYRRLKLNESAGRLRRVETTRRAPEQDAQAA